MPVQLDPMMETLDILRKRLRDRKEQSQQNNYVEEMPDSSEFVSDIETQLGLQQMPKLNQVEENQQQVDQLQEDVGVKTRFAGQPEIQQGVSDFPKPLEGVARPDMSISPQAQPGDIPMQQPDNDQQPPTEKPKNFIELLREAQATGQENIESAKTRQFWSDIIGAVNRGLSLKDAAAAARASGQSMEAVASNLGPSKDFVKEAQSEQQQRLNQLMQQYKLKKAEELTPYQKESIALQKRKLDESGGLTPYQQEMMDIRKSQLEQKEIREKDLQRNRILNQARGLLKDDPRYKKAIEQAMEFENANSLIEEAKGGNENAVAALGTKLARAMGEVGVLTDADVVRYVQGKSWGRKLKTWYEGGMKGEMPEESLNEIKKNLDTISSKLNTQLDNVYSNAGSRLETAFPSLKEKEIKGLLGRVETKKDVKSKPDNAGRIVNVKGKKYRVDEDGDTLIPLE